MPSWGPAPRWATARNYDRPTYGPAVAAIAAELGMPLMPWQRYVIDVIHEVDPATGWWAYDEAVIKVPRQAGKTTLKIPIYVHRLGSLERASLWMTAQSGTKALARWNAARAWMESKNSPIRDRIRSKVSIGHEEIRWLETQSTLLPFTPNATVMHGESPDLVDVDEWWFADQIATEELEQAYSPGFLTRNAQAIKTSTAGTSESYGLIRDTRRGREAVEMGKQSGLFYFEISLPDEIDGVPLDEVPDEVLIEAAIAIHPAIGFHPTAPASKMAHHIRTSEWEKLGRDGFVRAYGNREQEVSAGRTIPVGSWAAALAPKAIPYGVTVGLGLGIDPDGRDAAIAAAWRDDAGVVVVEVIKWQPGTAWAGDEFVTVAARHPNVQMAANNVGPARDVADVIETGGTTLLRLNGTDYSAACARVLKEITSLPRPTFGHIGQAELNAAAETVKKRRVGAGGGWAWAAGPVSIATLEAVTVAVWACDHPRETVPDLPPFVIR